MKKFITLLLITVFIISLVGCDNTTNPIITPQQTTHLPDLTPTQEIIGCYTPTPTASQVDASKFTNLYVTGNGVNVRKEANTNSEIITTLSLNTLVKGYIEKDGWYYISINDNTFGYMSSKYLSENQAFTTREDALDYKDLPKKPADADEGGTTYEMMQAVNYETEVYKAKISQVTQKIKDEDSKIGVKVDSLITNWNEFVPSNTQYYYDLVNEFEPQGTFFNLSRVSAISTEYKDLLDYLENVYLMMIGFEKYIDKEADDAQTSKENIQTEYDKLADKIIQINNKLVNEKNNNTNYAQQADKILKWHQECSTKINALTDLKWEILAELDFSKNSKSFEFYKTYDKYSVYKQYEYLLNDIDLIMRGESSFIKE